MEVSFRTVDVSYPVELHWYLRIATEVGPAVYVAGFVLHSVGTHAAAYKDVALNHLP